MSRPGRIKKGSTTGMAGLAMKALRAFSAIVPFAACVSVFCFSFASAVANEDLQVFLKSYCIGCHGAEEQSGERRFDGLKADIGDDDALALWQDVLDQLNLGEMPPAGEKQPEDAIRLSAIAQLTRLLDEYRKTHASVADEVVLRRMNDREYRNAVRDLFDLNLTMFDPTEKFPREQVYEHLDNDGDRLVTSGYLLNRYLESAEAVVAKAMGLQEKPEVRTWSFSDNLHQQPEIDQVHRKTNGYSHLTLYDVVGADKHEGAYAPIHDFHEGVPHDGFYEIRFRADALNREHPYDDQFLGTDRREPLQLGIVAGNHRVGPLHKPQPIEPLLASVPLADGSHEYQVRVWLDQGFTPRFTFRNGLMDARNLWSRVQRKYPELFPKAKSGIVAARYNAIANGQLPQIHVDDIEIRGPFFDSWPTASQRALFGDDWSKFVADEPGQSTAALRPHLARIMERAYRRPVRQEELNRMLDLVAKRNAGGRSLRLAYGDAVKAVLCSPNFLYLEENHPAQVEVNEKIKSGVSLDDWALASRLSFTLWASIPDDTLSSLADEGVLSDPEVLRQQVDRMLHDRRSQAFVNGFLDAWLALRDLGATPPERSLFRNYYHYDLGAAMLRETRMFARHLLKENLSIDNFLDSEFTFANKRLAMHYGLAPSESMNSDPFVFEKVAFTDDRRGGLLGQASVLTVTANGIDTSPVVRGVWVLENLLGTPPNPPPPDVEPLDPDTRGATTIREQLKKHRQIASCSNCHRKIDPLGFALENFDPVGQWRTSYKQGGKVDASGELPGERQFKDVGEMKELLLQQKPLFYRALVSKLLAYGMGRQLGPRDRPAIDAIVDELSSRGGGFRDAVELVVLSEPFRTP